MNIPGNNVGVRVSDILTDKAIYMKVPLNGTFELSPLCNFSCSMCYVRKTRKEVCESPRGILTLDDWRRIAKEARAAGMLNLLLTGGEPLLWPDFWTLYDELVDMGFLVSVNTNGSLIDGEAVCRFRKRPPNKINITLYGASDATYKRLCGVDGVFSKVDSAIKELIEVGITVKINCSLTPDNADDLDWIIDYAKTRGVPLTVATYMFPPVRRDPTRIGENARFTPEESAAYLMQYLRRDRGEKQFLQYMQNLQRGYAEPPGMDEGCLDPGGGKIRCLAGRAAFWITWDGWLMPCGMMVTPQIDLKQHGFSDAWNLLTEEAASIRLSGLCEQCANKDLCHPCAAIAYAETGSFSGVPTYKCLTVKHMCHIAHKTLKEFGLNSLHSDDSNM